VNYAKQTDGDLESPVRNRRSGGKQKRQDSDIDTDFQAHNESEDDGFSGRDADAYDSMQELEKSRRRSSQDMVGVQASQPSPNDKGRLHLYQSYLTLRLNSSQLATSNVPKFHLQP
jgi:hypothetical protein